MKLSPNEKILNTSMGGKLADWLKRITNKQIECRCGKEYIIKEVIGYPHAGGLPDKNKISWWPYTICPKCGYQLSYWKIDVRLARG